MNNTLLTERYGRGLMTLAEEKQLTGKLLDEVAIVRDVFSDKEISATFSSQAVTVSQKKDLIEKSFSGLSVELKNFLFLLIDKHRGEIISEVCDFFIKEVNALNGIGRATVTSAKPLSAEELEKISAKLAGTTGNKRMQLTNVVDPSVVGGIRVQVGNTVYDGTLKTKLAKLQSDFVVGE